MRLRLKSRIEVVIGSLHWKTFVYRILKTSCVIGMLQFLKVLNFFLFSFNFNFVCGILVDLLLQPSRKFKIFCIFVDKLG